MKEKTKILGSNLKSIRKAAGLTQMQVARSLGVSYQQIQKYEAGTNRLSAERLYDLQDIYKVGFERFFEGYEDNKPQYKHPNLENVYAVLKNIKDDVLRDKLRQIIFIFLD